MKKYSCTILSCICMFFFIANSCFSQIEESVTLFPGNNTRFINIDLGKCTLADFFSEKIQGVSGITIETTSVTVSQITQQVRATIGLKANSSKPWGIYNASIEYTVGAASIGGVCYTVTVRLKIVVGRLPIAKFSANTTRGPSPLNVNFVDESTDGNRWFWDFGDGSTSSERHPKHTYETVGLYDVGLTVSNLVGDDTDVKSGFIIVGACSSFGELAWTYKTVPGISSSPAIGEDGTIYVGSSDNNIYAFEPSGVFKWKYLTGESVVSSPAIGDGGTIYIGSGDKNLYAINPNGTLKWKYLAGDKINSSPGLSQCGTIYIGSHDNNLYAINPDGTLKWKFLTEGRILSSPTIGSDLTIYFGSLDKNIYALNPDGSLKWKFTTGSFVTTSATIDNMGTIYIASLDRNMYALNPDGKLKWNYNLGFAGTMPSSASIGPDGTIYIGTWGFLFAIDSAGTLKWNYRTGGIFSAATLGENSILVSTVDKFHSFAYNGTLLWSLPIADRINTPPALSNNGVIYVGTSTGLSAITSCDAGLIDSPWPKFGQNIGNTRNNGELGDQSDVDILGAHDICEGENSILTATGGIGYQWSTGEHTQNIEIKPTETTTYSVTVTNENGCTDEESITIAVDENPEISIEGESMICSGDSTVLNASGGTSFLWSTGENSSNITVSPSNTVDYTITVTNEQGCIAEKDFKLTVLPAPELSAEIVTQISCFGKSDGILSLELNGGTENFDFFWSSGQTSNIITIGPGIYSVTITDKQGCKLIKSYVISQPNAIEIEIAEEVGETSSLTANVSGGSPPYTFLWSDGQTLQTATQLVAGIYSLTITDNNGCEFVKSTSVSTTTNTIDYSLKKYVKLFPNPATKILYIELSEKIDFERVILIDILGQKLSEIPTQGKKLKVDVSEYSEGIYFVRLMTREKEILLPFVKNSH